MVRVAHVRKLRGQAPLPGEHTVRIDKGGIAIFPRLERVCTGEEEGLAAQRVPLDIAELDATAEVPARRRQPLCRDPAASSVRDSGGKMGPVCKPRQASTSGLSRHLRYF